MNFVYILQSQKNGKYYIGSTNNLERRLSEHNGSKTQSLKYLQPLILVFKKEFVDIKDARKMKLKLKRLKNKNIINQIVRDQKIKMGL